MGVLFLQAHEHAEGTEVGAKVKEVFRGHLPGHDTLGDAAFGKGADHFAELADLEPDDVIHQRDQRGIGFAFHGGADNAAHAGGSGEPGEFERQRAAAGNQTDGFERKVHAFRERDSSGLPARSQP